MNLLSLKRISNKPLRVLAVDPGAGKAGYAVVELDFESEKSRIIHMETRKGEELMKLFFDKDFIKMNNERTVKNLAHSKYLTLLLKKYEPNAVAVEDAYVRQITAYHSLIEHTTLHRAAVFRYDPFMEFCLVTASQAKAAVGVTGNSGDKTLITKALIELSKTKLNASGYEFTKQEEHANHAVAIGIGACYKALAILNGTASSKSTKRKKKKKART